MKKKKPAKKKVAKKKKSTVKKPHSYPHSMTTEMVKMVKEGKSRMEIRGAMVEVGYNWTDHTFNETVWPHVIKAIKNDSKYNKGHIRELHLKRYERHYANALQVADIPKVKPATFEKAAQDMLKALWHIEALYGFHKSKNNIKVVNNEVVIMDKELIQAESFIPHYSKKLSLLSLDERREFKHLLLKARKSLDGIWPVKFKEAEEVEFVEVVNTVTEKEDLTLEKAPIQIEHEEKPKEPEAIKTDLLYAITQKIKQKDKDKILEKLKSDKKAKQTKK